jgi:Txe/YoeB family toxin of Txe-Axe toxin-antitoxin module
VPLTVRLTRGYFRTARRLAPDGSTTANKLVACYRSLEHEPVPGPDDYEDFLPPVKPCWARRVSGTALVVLFERSGNQVNVLAVKVSA